MSQDHNGTRQGQVRPPSGRADRRGVAPAGRRPPMPALSGSGLSADAARAPTTLVRVLLCEDQLVFRLGLRVVLEAQPDMAVVAETAHLPGALAGAGGGTTQVVVGRQGVGGGATLPLLRGLGGGGPGGPGVAGPGGEG